MTQHFNALTLKKQSVQILPKKNLQYDKLHQSIIQTKTRNNFEIQQQSIMEIRINQPQTHLQRKKCTKFGSTNRPTAHQD